MPARVANGNAGGEGGSSSAELRLLARSWDQLHHPGLVGDLAVKRFIQSRERHPVLPRERHQIVIGDSLEGSDAFGQESTGIAAEIISNELVPRISEEPPKHPEGLLR